MTKNDLSFDALHDGRLADGAYEEFDYDAIDAALEADSASAEPATREGAESANDVPELVEAFAATLNLIVESALPTPGHSIDLATVGAKVVALLIMAQPGAFGTETASEVARRCGISKQGLNVHCRRFADVYGFMAPWQMTPERRARVAKAREQMGKRRKELAAALNAKG